MNSIKLTNDLVMIKKMPTEDLRTPAGILLPPVEESAETPYRGTVLAVGPGKPAKISGTAQGAIDALKSLVDAQVKMPGVNWGARGFSLTMWQNASDALAACTNDTHRMPMQVKVGDVVVFSRNGYQEFKLDGDLVLVMGESSIIGVLE